MSVWTENPVLRKEVATRLSLRRQSKANQIAIFVLLGAVVPILYWFVGRLILNPSANIHDLRDYYAIFVVGVELGLTVLLAPALTAGAITLEREKQTWNALLLSRLTPREIVWGKFWGSLLPAFVTLSIFLPINLIAAARAGVTLPEFALTHLMLVVTALFYGALGLFCSWACRRTQASTLAATGSVAVLTLGSFLAFVLWQAINNYSGVQAESFLPLWSNPFYVQSAFLDTNGGGHASIMTAYLSGSGLGVLALLGIVTARLADGPKEMTH